MIARIEMKNYKGFEGFSLKLAANTSILVGPNNAGKSTAIGALRLCAQLIAYAKRRKPEFVRLDDSRGRSVHAYRLAAASPNFIDENIAYEFRDVEARIEIHFKNKAAVYVAWPLEDLPYFYLEHIPGAQPPSLNVVRRDYPSVGVIQTLTPVEHREQILAGDYVRKSQGSRLASRHFRNQLYMVQQENDGAYKDFRTFALSHTPEIASLNLVRSSHVAEMDLYFTEAKSRVEKEIYWAGDGLQIWLQLLYHIWRHQNVASLIIDEPDVYLHPDLQRRLVQILENTDAQIILATHAPEVLTEANKDAVIVIDRTRKSSKRISNDRELSALNSALGSGFNLRLAKALRSRAALFVEGQDMKILSNLARTCGAARFYKEDGLTVVPMGGSSKRKLAESFGWLNTTILGSSVQVAVLLDRDFMDNDAVDLICQDFELQNVYAHIWKLSEIENYLLSVPTLARLSKLGEEVTCDLLDLAFEAHKEEVFGQLLARELQKGQKIGEHASTTATRTRTQFEVDWASGIEYRLSVTPGKDVLASLNQKIQAASGKAISARALSASIQRDEVPEELKEVIAAIESMLTT
jgi:hypothetical protein